MENVQDLSEISSKIVFVSRADTYFGKILTQYFAHVSLGIDQTLGNANFSEDLFDLSFLNSEAKNGNFEKKFKIFGTFRSEQSLNPYEASERAPNIPGAVAVFPAKNLENLKKIISVADICLFHLVDHDETNEIFEDNFRAIEIAAKIFAEKKSPKQFVLISSGMTWTKTNKNPNFNSTVDKGRGLDNQVAERPGFCEEEFRRRKPHPNFRRHFEFEQNFLKLGEDFDSFVTTTVIAAGVIYGYGENFLHWMFREAWTNSCAVSILGKGDVQIPTIHAGDLCQIVQNICLNPPQNRFIIAVDDSRTTLLEIGEAISKILSDGSVKHREPDDALMKKEITKFQFDIFTTNLVLETSTVRDEMRFKWVAKTGFVAAVPRLVKEYKILRNLRPLKLAVFGPPFSGKTTIAKNLCRAYNLHYVNAQEVLQKKITELEDLVKDMIGQEKGVERGMERGVAKKVEAMQILEEIMMSKEKNSGRVADHYVMRFVRDVLNSTPCQNQGFILDGYPESYSSAKDLFSIRSNSEADQKEEDSKQSESDFVQTSSHNLNIIPDLILFLDAPEDFLKQKILSQLYDSASETEPPIEVLVVQKFAEYNFFSNEEDNVVTFFDEAEIPVHFFDVTEKQNENGIKKIEKNENFGNFEKIEKILEAAMRRIGRPHNYSLTKSDKLTLLRREAERRIFQSDEKIKQENFRCEIEKGDRKFSDWKKNLENIYEEEKKPKKNRQIFMKKFLINFVFPFLTDGLTVCVAARPADPVDFLAEYLLRKSQPLYFSKKVSFTKMTK